MDFVEDLPSSHEFNTIVVVVDRFTKYAHFIPLKHPFTATGAAQAIFDMVVKLNAVPDSIGTDHDRIFLSSFWRELFKLLDTKLLNRTAYHPQTNGQTELVNQCLDIYLRCDIHETPKAWKNWFPLAEFWYSIILPFIQL